MTEPMRVKNWRAQQARDIEALIEKYRPKVVREYEENGVMVKVYEPVGKRKI